MFLTIYKHQFGWFSERGGNFSKFLERDKQRLTDRQADRQRAGGRGGGSVPRKGAAPSEKEGSSNPGGNYDVIIFQWHL